MPIELTNFTVWGRQWFADGWEGLRRFCSEQEIHGIELLATGATAETAPPADLIAGVHLRSLGSWLPLVGLQVPCYGEAGRRYQAVADYSELVRLRADELRRAAFCEPAYAVWHANYALAPDTPRPAQTPGNEGFLELLSRLVRDVLGEYEPPFALVFENAYGIGLDPEESGTAAGFVRSLGKADAGLCLDTGHHLNRLRQIGREDAACRELLRIAAGLERNGAQARVVHLHWTPPQMVPPQDGGTEPGDFFAAGDQHRPLTDPHVAQVISALAPKYLVHEMGAMSLAEHAAWLRAQSAAARGNADAR